jgi:excinuclease ABC subunit C
MTSELRDIPGVGSKTLTKLLREFGSLERVKAAPEAELARIVGPVQARRVREHFHPAVTPGLNVI